MRDFSFHSFSGEILVIDPWNDSKAEMRRSLAIAERKLSVAERVGLDLEWRPDRYRGSCSPVSLIQIAVTDFVLLLRTPPGFALPIWLCDLLESDSIPKVGVDFSRDIVKLDKSFDVSLQGEDDLRILASSFGIARLGFESLCNRFHYFPEKDDASRFSEWDSPDGLDGDQIAYAAEDAWFCLLIEAKLRRKSTRALEKFLDFKV